MSNDDVTRVIVTVGDERLDKLQDVVGELEDSGLVVEDVLEVIGQVTGTVESSVQVEHLRAVSGVEAVETERIVQLPPPRIFNL